MVAPYDLSKMQGVFLHHPEVRADKEVRPYVVSIFIANLFLECRIVQMVLRIHRNSPTYRSVDVREAFRIASRTEQWDRLPVIYKIYRLWWHYLFSASPVMGTKRTGMAFIFFIPVSVLVITISSWKTSPTGMTNLPPTLS